MTVLNRFPQWRWVVTDLNQKTLTFLDKFATQRSVLYTLNAPASATGRISSDQPEVNIVHTDGDPFLNEGNRFLYGFRREGGIVPWKVRYAGIVLQCNDTVTSDQPYTNYSSFDPWEYLNHVPCIHLDGSDPGASGMNFYMQRGSDIAISLLNNLLANGHGDCFIDWGLGTGYAGTIENTVTIDFQIQQGTSVGQALTDLCNTGTIDIVLKPIYDPIHRPSVLTELSTYNQVGTNKYGAQMCWDAPGRNLSGIDRLEDGQQRANVVQYYLANNLAIGEQTDVASIAKYREYWELKAFGSEFSSSYLDWLAKEELLVKKKGQTTIKVDASPEYAPVPFVEYNLGDSVPIYATKRLRKPLRFLARVYEIPIEITDDSVETVKALTFSSDSLTEINIIPLSGIPKLGGTKTNLVQPNTTRTSSFYTNPQ